MCLAVIGSVHFFYGCRNFDSPVDERTIGGGHTGPAGMGAGSGDCPKVDGQGIALRYMEKAPTYSKNIQKNISVSCGSCHSENGKKIKPLLDSYDYLRVHALASLVAIKNNSMPPPETNRHLRVSEIEEFERWITEGLAYGRDPTRRKATYPFVAYDNQIRDFLSENCLKCHGENRSNDPYLGSYDSARLNIFAILKSLKDGSMPPKSIQNNDWIELVSAWQLNHAALFGEYSLRELPAAEKTGSSNGPDRNGEPTGKGRLNSDAPPCL